MTEKQVNHAIDEMKEGLEDYEGKPLTSVQHTLISYLRSNVDDILDTNSFEDTEDYIDPNQMELF